MTAVENLNKLAEEVEPFNDGRMEFLSRTN